MNDPVLIDSDPALIDSDPAPIDSEARPWGGRRDRGGGGDSGAEASKTMWRCGDDYYRAQA